MKKVLEIVSVYRYDGVYIKCVWYICYYICKYWLFLEFFLCKYLDKVLILLRFLFIIGFKLNKVFDVFFRILVILFWNVCIINVFIIKLKIKER